MINIQRNIVTVLLFLLFTSAYAQSQKTLMLKLEVSNSGYNLLDAWILPRSFPASVTQEGASEGAINWEITSPSGAMLAKGIIADPQIVRAHLGESDELKFNQSRLEKATVIIRVPYDNNMQKLNIDRNPFSLPSINQGESKKLEKSTISKRDFLIVPREIK